MPTQEVPSAPVAAQPEEAPPHESSAEEETTAELATVKLIHDFESSELYEEALEARLLTLRREHKQPTIDDVRSYFRSTREYLDAFSDFWYENPLSGDEEIWPDELGKDGATNVLHYCQFIKNLAKHYEMLKLRLEASEAEARMIAAEQRREFLHMQAALSITKGLEPLNDDDREDEELGRPPTSRTTVGRHIVMYLAEAAGYGEADPNREEVKVANKTYNMFVQQSRNNQEARD